jgi:putative acetyltransferase
MSNADKPSLSDGAGDRSGCAFETSMNSLDIIIRDEQPGDHAAIYDLTARAFAPMPYSDGDEQDLIDALRAAGALAISLVALLEGKLVGHVAFSPATAADGSAGWYALGPVSAEPELQRQGIGSALIHEGIRRLREREAAGCILVGNPDYYSRFGFRPYPTLAPAGQPPEYFMILPLAVTEPSTVVEFHPAFATNIK